MSKIDANVTVFHAGRAAVREFSSSNAVVSSGKVVLTKERTPSAPSAGSNR